MTWKLAGLLLVAGTVSANAGLSGLVGNDTGGIIPWTPDTRLAWREMASDHCAHYYKRARITSVHRRYGDYIGFVCYFPRGYDPVRDAAYGHAISTLD